MSYVIELLKRVDLQIELEKSSSPTTAIKALQRH